MQRLLQKPKMVCHLLPTKSPLLVTQASAQGARWACSTVLARIERMPAQNTFCRNLRRYSRSGQRGLNKHLPTSAAYMCDLADLDAGPLSLPLLEGIVFVIVYVSLLI